MSKRVHLHSTDLRGVSRMAFDATVALTDLVEAMHHNIATLPTPFGAPRAGPTRGITGLVYRSIRGVTRTIGGGVDAVLAQLGPLLRGRESTPERDAVLATLNGVLGDYLALTANPLAIPMRLRRNGAPLELARASLAAAIPDATDKLLVLAHGLCLNDRQWRRSNGHDHGAALACDLGYTPVYLHYNTGLHISTNGRAFAALVDTLVAQWPMPVAELAIVGHSMGGLVARSACRCAEDTRLAWRSRLRHLVFLGTPHGGAPMERGGHWIDVILGASPYVAPLARLGKIRSAGITDLRHGSICDEDWQEQDRFAHTGARPRRVPLPEEVDCFAIGATTGQKVGDVTDRLLGDGLVPLSSALGRDRVLALAFPASRQWIGFGMNHLELLARPEVYERIRSWLAGGSDAADPAPSAPSRRSIAEDDPAAPAPGESR